MWPTHTVHRHLCVLFLTSALITTLFLIKKRSTSIGQDVAASKLNRTFRNGTNCVSNNNGSQKINSLDYLKINASQFNAGIKNNNDINISHTIYVLGLFELTTKWGERAQGRSEVAAAQLAVEHINNFGFLSNYKIELLINDTKCDPGVGIDTFFHAIYSKKTIIMLLGTSCSNVTESLAHVVPYWNILQISYGSTSPTLSDRKKFPLFFRTIAPDSSHNAAKIEFVKNFGWKVFATFCQSENDFLLPLNNLIADFEKENISCVITITFSLDNYKEQLKILKNSDIRIIIGSFSAELATKIFCEVYRLEMYGADYVWILQDRHEQWWDKAVSECDYHDMTMTKTVMDGIILVSDFNTVYENRTSISGLDNDMFENELKVPRKEQISKYARLTYDAIWAMALTLREVQTMGAISYEDFNYASKDVVCKFVDKMSSLNFMGVSGPVKFIGPDRIGSSLLQQLQDGKMKSVAVYNSNKSQLDFNCNVCHAVNWENGQTPIAQRILKVSLITIPRALLYLITFTSILGIAASLLFLFFNLHFRRIKTVKLSSPKLNNVAVIGCIFVYVSVILLGLDTDNSDIKEYFNELCSARVYLLSSGVSLAFGSMFAKTYRVHRIFASYGGTAKVTDKLLKDKQLIALILTPLAIDAVILALWVMIDPMQRQLYNLTLEINSEDRGVVYQPQVEICRSQNTSGWFIAIYSYKALILIMGVFMAWETRHVKVQALNDAQYIGICVYSAVFSAIVAVLSSLTSEYVVFSYLARTVSILTSTTLTLCLLLLPKLKSVFGHNHVDPIMQSMGLKIECNTRRFIMDDTKEQIYRLEVQNRVYRCELEALNLEISQLEGFMSEKQAATTGEDLPKVFAAFKDDTRFLHVPRNIGWGSWPESCETFAKTRNEFLSEHRLNHGEQFFDKFALFGKWIFSLSSVVAPRKLSGGLLQAKHMHQKYKSNPDFHSKIATISSLVRAKSHVDVAQSANLN